MKRIDLKENLIVNENFGFRPEYSVNDKNYRQELLNILCSVKEFENDEIVQCYFSRLNEKNISDFKVNGMVCGLIYNKTFSGVIKITDKKIVVDLIVCILHNNLSKNSFTSFEKLENGILRKTVDHGVKKEIIEDIITSSNNLLIKSF